MNHVISHRYEISGCEVVWAIRDDSISSTFFDAGAATFFLPHLDEQSVSPPGAGGGETPKKPLKRSKYTLDSSGNGNKKLTIIKVRNSPGRWSKRQFQCGCWQV